MINSLKGIIFDFDNTLVKSNIDFPGMKIEMARLTKNFGLEFGIEEEIPHKYTAGNIIDKAESFDKRNGTMLVPQLWQVVEEYERKGMENITIDQDVLTMLNSMKNFKIETALLTNNACNPTVEVLKRFNMIDYFSIIVAREDVKKMKPDKEGIDLILLRMKLHPNEVLFIGDSWVDAKAANEAEVPFVLIRNDLLDTQKYGITIWKHIRSMGELIQVLKES